QYLLTGQPPFPSGNLAEKVARHMHAEPPLVEKFRKDVPAGLQSVLGRMLAKQPNERYQTPAEVAAALGLFGQPRKTVGSLGAWNWLAGWRQHLQLRLLARKRWVLLFGSLGILLLVFLVALLFRGPTLPSAQAALQGLRVQSEKLSRAQIGDTKEVDWLRRDIVKFRMDYPGTPEAVAAGALFMQLPSPLDQLDPEMIPRDKRLPNQPKELVAAFAGYAPAFGPDGTILATGAKNGEIYLCDTATGQKRRLLRGHKGSIVSLAFSPDGKTIASTAYYPDMTVKLWEVATGKELGQVGDLHFVDLASGRLTFSPDGKTLVGSTKFHGKLWDVVGCKERVS